MKVKISKEDIVQITVTTIITFIVGVMGFVMFGVECGIYSALTSGLCIGVGKEYADSLSIENSWSWNDVITACSGSVLGLIMFLIFYFMR